MTAVPSTPATDAKPRRARMQVVTLTDAAADRLKSIVTKSAGEGAEPVIGLRIGVKKGGCAGMEYTMEYATRKEPFDEIVEDKGATVLIDPKAIMYLVGTVMDYKTEKLSAGFVFENPNQTSACGCGESVAIAPAKLDG